MAFSRIVGVFRSSFGDISVGVWWLSLIMLINRTGSMVFPFLSIYLTQHLHFSTLQTGWVLSMYGIGAMVGSLVGGWIADRFGNFRIQVFSLIFSGIGWWLLSYVSDYSHLLILVFFQTCISESFRPANSSAIAALSRPENMTRSYSLNRMSINLGYTLGPAIAGFLATISYSFLFWVDGTSSILAGIVFMIIFRKIIWGPRPATEEKDKIVETQTKSPVSDIKFLFFIGACILFATVFLQLIFTLPLYYKEIYHLSDQWIGLLLAINGGIVVLSEMVIVYIIGNRIRHDKLIILGTLCIGISFVVLTFFHHPIILILGILLISYGEIFSMPYLMTYVTNISNDKNRGRYMSFYSISFSIAMVIAPFAGMRIIKYYGFDMLWYVAFFVTILLSLIFYYLLRIPKKQVNVVALSGLEN